MNTFTNADEVKKWLRGLNLTKKELKSKIKFYEELVSDFSKARNLLGKTANYDSGLQFYNDEITFLNCKMKELVKDYKRLTDKLEANEKLIISEKYLSGAKWEYIELSTFISRRQAFRIHNAAITKLIGQSVELGNTGGVD
ncbi:MAG: hypothetical protein RSB38_08735 [Oscillospiraceae bacterium]